MLTHLPAYADQQLRRVPALQHSRRRPGVTGLKSRTSDLPSVFTPCQLSIDPQPTHLTRQLSGPTSSFQDSVTFALSIAFTHFDPWTKTPGDPHLSPLRSLANGPQILQQSLSARLCWSLPASLHLTHVGVSLHPTAGTCVPPLSRRTTESTERAKPQPPVAVAVAATPRCGTSSPPPGSSSMYEGGQGRRRRLRVIKCLFFRSTQLATVGSTLIQRAIPLSPHWNCSKIKLRCRFVLQIDLSHSKTFSLLLR